MCRAPQYTASPSGPVIVQCFAIFFFLFFFLFSFPPLSFCLVFSFSWGGGDWGDLRVCLLREGRGGGEKKTEEAGRTRMQTSRSALMCSSATPAKARKGLGFRV